MSNLNLDVLSKLDNEDAKEDLNYLKTENKHLQFILSKYNYILNDYQVKYGSELFLELERQLNYNSLASVQSEMSVFKQILIENVSLIKEYEKEALDKSRTCELLTNELNHFQNEIEKLVEENKMLREDLETTKEDKNKMYRSILGKSESKGAFMMTGNSNNINDLNSSIEFLKSQNEQLLSMLEQSKQENDNLKQAFLELKDKYNKIESSYESSNSDLQKVSKERDDLAGLRSYVEEKLFENNNKLMINERKTNEAVTVSSKLECDNKFLKEEVEHYKSVYDELEQRKNSEMEALMRSLDEMVESSLDLKTTISDLEDKNSELKFENNKLKHDLQVMKNDLDHLTKILDESNFAVRSANEKEKQVDLIVKNSKKKLEEAQLEKEKLHIKIKFLEKQITKLTEDFSKQLSEKQSQFENFIDSSQEKFQLIINNKDEEISIIKNENLALRIEKDKYSHEYNVMKKELDKFSHIFREENGKYIRKYEESEKSSNKLINQLNEKINSLSNRCEKLEYEKGKIEDELSLYKSTDKSREQLLEKINRNEENLLTELEKTKEKCESLEKEQEHNRKESDKTKNIYEIKINNLKEQYDLRIRVVENTLKSQKEEYSQAEEKAYEMLKKQENMTNKFKDEYHNIVKYYEHLIEKMISNYDHEENIQDLQQII